MAVGTQDRECREWAESNGWNIVAVYDNDNDISAHSGKRRPDWERLLEDLTEGKFDGLLAQDLDRMLRRVKDLGKLIEALDASPTPVQVAFSRSGLTDWYTPGGRLNATILAAVAENESSQKAIRVKSARRREALAGKAHTLLGYGYNDDQTINAAERDIVVEVKDRLLAGHTLLSIARDLNERGVPTPAAGKWTSRHVERAGRLDDTPDALKRLIEVLTEERAVPLAEASRLFNRAGGNNGGARWTAMSVRKWTGQEVRWLGQEGRDTSQIARILIKAGVPTERMYWRAANLRSMIRRGSLCGWREFSPGQRGGHGDLVAKGSWTPILAVEETKAIRKVTDKRAPIKGGRAAQHLLTGFLRCGKCGTRMGGHLDKKTGLVRYQCSTQPGLPDRCGKVTIVGGKVEEMVTEVVLDLLASSGFRTTLRTGQRNAKSPTRAEVAKLEAEVDRFRNLLDDAFQQSLTGDLPPHEYAALRKAYTQRIQSLERTLGAYNPTVRAVLSGVPTDRARLDEYWQSAGLLRQRQVLSVLIDRIEIAPVTKRSNQFQPDRVGAVQWLV